MIKVIVGCMGAGKSSYLIDSIEQVKSYSSNIYVATHTPETKHNLDHRFSVEKAKKEAKIGKNEEPLPIYMRNQPHMLKGKNVETFIESRNGKKVLCNRVNPLSYDLDEADADYYFLDECQWLSKGELGSLIRLSEKGKTIYCAGLSLQYNGYQFKKTGELLNYADNIIKLNSLCAVTGKLAKYNELIGKVGSIDKNDYRAVCWEVFSQSVHCQI